MIFPRNILSLIVMMAFIVSSLFLMPKQAEAKIWYQKVCKKNKFKAVGGLWGDRFAAKTSAKIAWSRRARKRYGKRYMAWPIARNKHVKCSLRRKARYYKCKVKARPCKLVKRRR